MVSYFGIHNHTEYSNLRLLDSINKPKDLIYKAKELGLTGVAITDHEALCSHIKVNKIAKELRETDPEFTVALGNEIYLTETRENGQKYYHFLLLAKDEIGYRALKELSSIAWYNMYKDKMERVPTLKSELKEVISKYKGHVIATTACMGGELSTNALLKKECLSVGDYQNAKIYHQNIEKFIQFCHDLFGDDFYIECAPSNKNDQVAVNQELKKIADYFKIKMVVGTDAHYLTAKERPVHKAYLNSKDGDREVDDFYEFAHLMTPDECAELLNISFNDLEFIEAIFNNTVEIQNKIEFFTLEKHQDIPQVEVFNYPKGLWRHYVGVNSDLADEFDGDYKLLKELFNSDNIQERYWINQCFEALLNKGIGLDERYLHRLVEEANVKRVIGEKLNTCMFAYPNTLQHYVDLFWECGSTVGAGRGSACSGLNHFLLGITQLDPIEWSLPFWRYLNTERVELGDIDLDLAPSRLPRIFEKIRDERGELGLVQVCTFGTEATKSAVLTACRGYRSKDYPDGIDVDEAQFLTSLIPVERGFLWPVNDVINGNKEKNREPQSLFIKEVSLYPGLINIIQGIEGLVSRRGSHASGIIFFDDNIYDTAAIMRTPSGSLVTQWDLHDQEAAGSVKYDFLVTEVQDKIIQTVKFLQNDNLIDSALSLKQVYDKYLHPAVLPKDNQKMWDALRDGSVLDCFQFDSEVGAQAAKKIAPRSPLEMADANGLMRLMSAEKGAESALDKYVRFKNNIALWYQEMKMFGLTEKEMRTVEPHFLKSYGVPPSQEQLMTMLMDEDICSFSLADANAARKIVGKKQMDKIPSLHEKILKQAKSPALGSYIWKCGVGPQLGYSFSIVKMVLTHLTVNQRGSCFIY